ncbi:DegT/DnrJ/EryC1/StrS family aminotransferase [Litorivicinus sp.]|nr:DegT/DnrJ/EryC1/StrS family aminotransferase [Litorivicinus sp.]
MSVDVLSTRLRRHFSSKKIGLHEPQFNCDDSHALLQCLESSFVSSAGPQVDIFETLLCEFTGTRFAVATNSGTSGLHLSLLANEIGPGDEVLLPALTFCASANAILYTGATPNFLDIDNETLGIHMDALSEWLKHCSEKCGSSYRNRYTGRRLAAIMPVHLYGHIGDMDRLQEIADEYKLRVVEDAAEALGSCYNGVHPGNFGQCGVLSFNGNKIITTGGGGMVLTNDKVVYKRVKHLASTARVAGSAPLTHDSLGYNYTMPSLNAALGISQFKKIRRYLKEKRYLFDVYKKICSEIDGIEIFEEPRYCKSNYWLNNCVFDEPLDDIAGTIGRFAQDGIEVRAAWDLMPKLPYLREFPCAPIPNSSLMSKRLLNIPSGPKAFQSWNQADG